MRLTNFISEEHTYVSKIVSLMMTNHPNVFDKLLISETKDTIELTSVVVNNSFRGKGYLSILLDELTNHADNTNKIIHLFPSNEYGTDKSKLESIYRKWGFEYNKKDKRFDKLDMIRYPKVKN
jgi:N-acetylglutamate synthase-like GNAT family acetyltransferase